MAELITTTKGLMDPAQLVKREGAHDNEHETVSWVEYYDGPELVHRSAHVHVKEGLAAMLEQAGFGDQTLDFGDPT